MKQRMIITILTALLVAFGAAFAQDAAEPMTREAAQQQLFDTLEGGIENVATPDLVVVLSEYRESIEAGMGDDTGMQVLATAVQAAEDAFMAEPFDEADAIEALQELALALRIVSDASDEPLTTELASLLDQTAEYIEGEGYTPRLEVDTP